MTRNEAREILMQIMYEMESSGELTQEKAGLLAQERLSGNHIDRGQALLNAIIDHLDEIDQMINDHSTRWKTSRMPKVDLALMRVALGEILYSEDIPDAVAVNEAINIARKFSTDHSAKFIHGVLGAILRDVRSDTRE